MITANIIERTDAKKRIMDILDISIGTFINNDLIFGFTNEKAFADYIREGYNPIHDSLIVSNFQLFFKYYYHKESFFMLKIPTASDAVGISILDRARVGGGYIFYSKNNFDFEISYDFLLSPNINGWKKGKLIIGVSTDTGFKLPMISFDSNLFHKFVNWINTPLNNGYKESMFLTNSQ